ncbi:MAG: hypothetical protein CME65_00040 [Halobacteriovoraceae bacterium]|nr:hypothetical protein [Halobacteriovoraceae bacterium]|tara:strand:+ start:1917 stop:2639 length:723 start_codon:yes stop_codon:yes gene_type:complete
MTKLNVEITKRDMKLFKYLFANKVATNEQIRVDVFEGSSKQVVHRRLDKLISAKYLDAKYLRTKGNCLIYFLTNKAMTNYIGVKKDLIKAHKKSYCPYHDLALVDIKRRLLESEKVTRYFSENILSSGICDNDEKIKSIRELSPDAVLKVNIQGEEYLFTLEYERSQKAFKRYDTLIKNYYQNHHVQAVLFICENKQIQNQVMQAEKKIATTDDFKFFYTTLGEIKSLSFINQNQEVLQM